IRDKLVTGVQTCALPIFASAIVSPEQVRFGVPANLIRINILAELVPLLVIFALLAGSATPRIAATTILALVLLQRVVEDGSIYRSEERRVGKAGNSRAGE